MSAMSSLMLISQASMSSGSFQGLLPAAILAGLLRQGLHAGFPGDPPGSRWEPLLPSLDREARRRINSLMSSREVATW